MLEATQPLIGGNAIVTVAPQRSLVSIGAFKHSAAALQALRGLPATPTRNTADGITYLWSGPGAWLAFSDDPDLEVRLRARMNDLAAITDQSDGRVILRIAAAQARATLAKLVPIDLHPDVFTPHATALTLAGHISVQLWQADDGAFELACFRSFAADLYAALVAALPVEHQDP